MKFREIIMEETGALVRITLNRPSVLNALNSNTIGELEEALRLAETSANTRVIIFTGMGTKSFSAGGDIHELSSLTKEQFDAFYLRFNNLMWKIANLKFPTIAAMNGLAFGGGALFATVCDIRIGCEASRFSFLASKVGHLINTWTLPVLVGLPKAKELLFTGSVVAAEEALRIGLLNKLVSSDDVLKCAIQIGQDIAGNSAESIQSAKQILNDGIGSSWVEMRQRESESTRTFNPPAISESFKEFLSR